MNKDIKLSAKGPPGCDRFQAGFNKTSFFRSARAAPDWAEGETSCVRESGRTVSQSIENEGGIPCAQVRQKESRL